MCLYSMSWPQAIYHAHSISSMWCSNILIPKDIKWVEYVRKKEKDRYLIISANKINNTDN